MLFFDEGRIGKKDQNAVHFDPPLLPPALSGDSLRATKFENFAKHLSKSGRTKCGLNEGKQQNEH